MTKMKTKNKAQKNDGLYVEGLGKSYSSHDVLKDINMELKKGEVVGLFGSNGAGKTTCFYSVSGFIQNDKGSVSIDGVDVTTYPMYVRSRMGLGYLPQENSIFRGLNVEQNIMAILETVEPKNDLRKQMLESLLNEFSILHLRYSPSVALSGGERRRLEIARCLATGPSYILLDEPLAGVDPVSVKEIAELINKLKQKNIGVLITDHNVRETLKMVDRAYILHDGKILKQGTPAQIVKDKKVKEVYLGKDFKLN